MDKWPSAGSLDKTGPEQDPDPLRGQHHRRRSLTDVGQVLEPQVVTSIATVPVPVVTGTGISQPVPMEADCNIRAELGAAQHQSHNARRMGRKAAATSLVTDGTFFQSIVAEQERVGSMNPPGDTDVLRTFRGVRQQRAGENVDQYVTFSLDPSNLQCLSCAEEHPIIQGHKPVVVILSDENFVPLWPNTDKEKCVVVIRIEGGGLLELTDIFSDVFGKSGLPEGSVLLLGSLTHLHRFGVSHYAREWTKLVMSMSRSWPSVRLGPLIPLIREDVPGGVARELTELASWFGRMYTGNIQGLAASWNMLVTTVVGNATGHTVLTNQESYTMTLPVSLDARGGVQPHTFVTRCSRPSVLKSIDQGQQGELLNAISEILDKDFHIQVSIRGNSVNATEQIGVKGQINRIILVGASNLHRVAAQLSEAGLEVVNLCIPGWVATPAKVAEMIEKLATVPTGTDTAIIFDVLGNSTFRYESYDGSVLLPTKVGGGTTCWVM